MKHLRLFCLSTLICLTFWAVVSSAQTSTGRVTGTVTDQSGAVVSGATINATNVGTSRTVTVQSGAAGEYSIPALEPGAYKIEVTAPNFKSSTQNVTDRKSTRLNSS